MMMSFIGILFLGILGGFFYWNCNTLFEEVGVESGHAITHAGKNKGEFERMKFMRLVDHKYKSCAYNCWIAAALYVVTLVGTYWQNRWNQSSAIN